MADLPIDDLNVASNDTLITPDQLNAYDVVVSDDLVFTKAAFDAFVAGRAAKEDSK